MTKCRAKIPDRIQQALDEVAKPYHVREGKKHNLLYVDGFYVGILPKNGRKDSNAGRGSANLASQIRRAVELKGMKA